MKTKKSVANYEAYYRIFYNWLKLKNEGKTLQSFFDDNYIKTLAIYGMGELGRQLYKELQVLNVNILYAIDKNAANIEEIDGLKIVTPDEKLEKVDAVLVTPVHFYYEIEKMLDEKGISNVISLEDVVVYCL